MKKINKDIISILDLIQGICGKYGVNKMYIFGSSLTDRYQKGESDLDVLIDIDDLYLRNIVRIKSELTQLTGSRIDLFKVEWIKTEEMLNYLKNNKVLIYNKENDVTNTVHDDHAPNVARRMY